MSENKNMTLAEAAAEEAAIKAAEKEAEKVARAEAAAARKAERDAAREAAKAAKEAEKQERAAAREAARAAKEAEKEARRKAREEARAAREAERLANKREPMPMQNGIRRPRPEGKCGQIWALMDSMSQELGAPVAVRDVLPVADAQGMNQNSVRTQYSYWRKFHGIETVIVRRAEQPQEAEQPAA